MSMDQDELDAIRRRKMAELQQAQVQAQAEAQYRDQQQAQRQLILRQILTPEARERLGRIELAYPELKENIENQLIALPQSGRVQRMIDDPTLRQILQRAIPPKRHIKIERRCPWRGTSRTRRNCASSEQSSRTGVCPRGSSNGRNGVSPAIRRSGPGGGTS